MQLADAVCDLLGRADQREATVAHRHAIPDQREQIVREAVGVSKLQAHEIVGGRPVGVLAEEVIAVIAGLLLGRAADHVREGEYIDLAPAVTRLLLQLRNLFRGARQIDGRREQEVRVAGRELAAQTRARRVDDWRLAGVGLRVAVYVLQVPVVAFPVEATRLGPELAYHIEPLLRIGVAGLVIVGKLLSERLVLGLVPTRNDVEARAPLAYLVDGGDLLGDHHRVVHRRVHRGKHADAPCGSKQR